MGDSESLFREREYELRKVQFRFAQMFSIALGVAFVVALFATYYIFREISTINKKNAYLVAQELNNVRENTKKLFFELKQQEKELITLRKSITNFEAMMFERLAGQDRQIHALKLAEKGLAGEELTATEEKFVESEAEKAKDDETSASFYLRGYAAHVAGNYDSAVTNFTKAIEIGPPTQKMYTDRGFAHRRLGKYKEALSDYDKAIELDQNYSTAYRNRGVVYMFLGDWNSAKADFQQAGKGKGRYFSILNRKDPINELQRSYGWRVWSDNFFGQLGYYLIIQHTDVRSGKKIIVGRMFEIDELKSDMPKNWRKYIEKVINGQTRGGPVLALDYSYLGLLADETAPVGGIIYTQDGKDIEFYAPLSQWSEKLGALFPNE